MTNLLEVRDLVKHFPIRRGIIFQRQVGGPPTGKSSPAEADATPRSTEK